MNKNPYESPRAHSAQEVTDPTVASMHSIPFRTFILLNACIGFSSGVIAGIVILAISPTGEFDIQMGSLSIEGLAAGLFMLFVSPLYFAIVLAVFSIPGYIPFRIVFKLIGRQRFTVVTEVGV